MKEILSRSDTATKLKVRPETVSRIARKGLIERVTVGAGTRAVGYTRESVERLMRKNGMEVL